MNRWNAICKAWGLMGLGSLLNLSHLSICCFTFFSLLFLLPCFTLFLVSCSTFLYVWFISLCSQLCKWHIAEYDEYFECWRQTNRSEKCETLLFALCNVCTTFDDACCAYYWVCTRNYLFNVNSIKIVIMQKCLKWNEQTYISSSLQGWLRLLSGTWWRMSFSSWIVARRNTTVASKGHLGMKITLQNASCRRPEGVGGSGNVAPLFLNLGTRWGGKTVLPLSKDPPGTYWIGSSVDQIACLDALEKRNLLPISGM
jgi:hypothetical protein